MHCTTAPFQGVDPALIGLRSNLRHYARSFSTPPKRLATPTTIDIKPHWSPIYATSLPPSPSTTESIKQYHHHYFHHKLTFSNQKPNSKCRPSLSLSSPIPPTLRSREQRMVSLLRVAPLNMNTPLSGDSAQKSRMDRPYRPWRARPMLRT